MGTVSSGARRGGRFLLGLEGGGFFCSPDAIGVVLLCIDERKAATVALVVARFGVAALAELMALATVEEGAIVVVVVCVVVVVDDEEVIVDAAC